MTFKLILFSVGIVIVVVIVLALKFFSNPDSYK